MRKSLLYAALIAALAVLVCGGTPANPQEEEAVAQTSGGVGQFKGQCRTAGTSLNDPIVKPYYDDPATTQMEYAPTAHAHRHNFWGNLGVASDPSIDTVEELSEQRTSCEDGSQDGGDPAYLRKNTSSYWMPQPYINGRALIPRGSGFYYSSKGGLDPTKTTAPPIGLELIARHKDQTTDDTQAAEIDIACPAGSLTGAQQLPNGKDSVPEPGTCKANSTIDIAITFPECLEPATNLGPHGERIAHRAIHRGSAGAHCLDAQQQIPTLQEFFTFSIPDRVGYYAGTSSLTFAGHDEPMPYNNIHADYFDAEHMRKLVEFCINAKNSLSPNCK
jgi:Domain of unknown function (DUF1996)